MEKVTGIPGEHMTREQTLDGVEAIIGKAASSTKSETEEKPDAANQEPNEASTEDDSKPASEDK